ncbi:MULTISPECIES: putative O-glycosylation ligase, exosortase A system-associated [Methylomonas]|uniref:putative O-glycosylation ligase, exosortase A system-associated n=1 Tax=Methylomonas TaxID=416 RepID=UPI001231B5FE|nr:putative O-glycosylation ligase, exosortase A system-associated [Methylomonas rhizoryzae]
MRDIIVTSIVLIGCLYTLRRPYIGILLWSWLSYMNPHRLTYGFAFSMPFAQITALTLMLSMLVSKEVRKPPLNTIIFIWFSFVLFMGVSTLFAFFFEDAWAQYIKVIKIQLVVFLTLMLITDLDKLNQLLSVIVLSIGYYSVKGGVFTVLTGGGYRVWGPAGSFIEGNNELAVAALMIIPIMVYLHKIYNNKFIKYILIFSIVSSFIGAIGTQSRGALVAFGAVLVFFWLKSDKKIIYGLLFSVAVALLFMFMPESWQERMNTINTYESDASAMGRINAWEYAFNVANNHLLGLGFESWSPITFAMYAPNPNDVHAAHSIYFSVLADHGWIGLLMYLSIFYFSWKKLKELIRNTDGLSEYEAVNFLARMLQVTLIGYFVGGAFLSLSYFDLPWHIVAFIQIISKIRNTNESIKSNTTVPVQV